MRRTEREFKAEVLRRGAAYRQRRRKRIRTVLLSLGCIVLCVLALPFVPIGMGGSTMDAAAAEEMEVMGQYSGMTDETGAPAAAEPRDEAGLSNEGGQENAFDPITVQKIKGCIVLEVSEEDAAILSDLLANVEWVEEKTRCIMDYSVTAGAVIYEFSSECGVFYNTETGRSGTLSEDDRLLAKKLLEKYN